MAHDEHNRPKKGGGYALIIFGAFLFIIAPILFKAGTVEGSLIIVSGFVIGGIGFYLRFLRKRKVP